ncbi:MAG: hypothetical protein WC353_03105 [Candidatus Peribacter sp.]
MTKTHLRHRHLVALPLFLAVLGLSVIPSLPQTSSLIASTTGRDNVITLADGAQMLLGEGADIDTSGPAPVLQKGSALIRTEGIVQIRTPVCDILTIAGAFHVVAGESLVTVSAITAPVLLSTAGHRAIVSPGQQMRIASTLTGIEAGAASWQAARTSTALPGHFLREQLRALQNFPAASERLPASQSLIPPDEPVIPSAQLAAAQERAREAWRIEILGSLRWYVEQKDDNGARAILTRPAFRTALADGRSLSSLVTLASRTEDGAAGLRPLLVKFLTDRHDLWLLAALHPAFHTGAWVAGMPSLTPEEQVLLAFVLPLADRAPQGFSPVVVRWWQEEVSTFIAGQSDPLSLVEPLLTSLLPVVEQNIADNYPERAQRLAHALMTFSEPVSDQLPPELHKSLISLQQRVDPHVELFPSSADSSSSIASVTSVSSASSSSLPPIDPQERVRTVEFALEQAGALFSLQTKLEPSEDSQSVHVRDILFSSSKGDLPYAFDVNARTMQVSSIVQNGKLLPYPMEMDAFLQWVRQ